MNEKPSLRSIPCDAMAKLKFLPVLVFALFAHYSLNAQLGACLQEHIGIPLQRDIQNPFSCLSQTKITFFGPANDRLNGVLGYSFTHFFDKNDFIEKRRNHGIHYGFKFQNVFSDKLAIDLLGSYNFMSFQVKKEYQTIYVFPNPKSEWTQYGVEVVFHYKVLPKINLNSGIHSIIQRTREIQNSHVWFSAGIGILFVKS